MRITRDFMIRTTRDHLAKRMRQEKDIVAAYLIGSAIEDSPLLGGTTDIDLVLVHVSQPACAREIVRVNDEVHLDVAHHAESQYQQPRVLRADAWMGTAIQKNPLLLHDIRHWFEFIQASVGSQFYHPEQTARRARSLLSAGRDSWNEICDSKSTHIKKFRKYLSAVEDAANAAACLSGPPLTRRRFLLELPERCAAIDAQGLLPGFTSLLQLQDLSPDAVRAFLPEWEKAFTAAGAQEQSSPDLHPLRLEYYKSAINAHLEDGQVLAAAYPLMVTWAGAVSYLYATSPEYITWFDSMKTIGLGKDQLAEKVDALDAYLDHVEEVLDDWAVKNGA